MSQSRTGTVLSPRSSLSSSPFSSTSSIDSPLISDSISDWAHNPDAEHHSHNRRRSSHHRHHRYGIHSPAEFSSSNSLPSSASASDPDSAPMTPWNGRPSLALPEISDGQHRQGHSSGNEHLNLDDVDDAFFDENENNNPPLYLGHTRWKQTQGTPGQQPANLPGDRTNTHVGRGATLHRRTKFRTKHTHRNVYYERHLSRDFFLILTLCFVLACFLICLTRPALVSWFSSPASLLGLDELL